MGGANFRMKVFNKQTGDTIVEVMIAIVVMSGVLGASFAISNKAAKGTQANHERFQAQMYANQQAEWIKAYATTNRDTLLANTVAFCMTSPTNIVKPIPSDGTCTKDSLYKITITPAVMSEYIGSGSNTNNTFYIRVIWDSLTSASGEDQLELVYGL